MSKLLNRLVLVIFINLAVSWLSGCAGQPALPATITASVQPTQTRLIPTFIHHLAPDLASPTDWIENGGCPVYENRIANCSENSEIKKLGCDEIEIIQYLGGLPYPIARCNSYREEPPDPLKFIRTGGLLSEHYSTNIVYKNGSYQLISDIGELRSDFSSINSPGEALSYAIVAFNLRTSFDERFLYDLNEHAVALVNTIEDTYVEEKPDGYLVHLFTYPDPLCGCGIHTVSSVDVLVHPDGRMEELKKQPVYQEDYCCD